MNHTHTNHFNATRPAAPLDGLAPVQRPSRPRAIRGSDPRLPSNFRFLRLEGSFAEVCETLDRMCALEHGN